MRKLEEIRKNRELFSSCKRNGVNRLYLFGSALTEKFNIGKSDLDFFVEMNEEKDPLIQGENLIFLWDDLERIFKTRVDLLTPNSLINPILKKSVNSSKILIYDGRKQEIFV